MKPTGFRIPFTIVLASVLFALLLGCNNEYPDKEQKKTHRFPYQQVRLNDISNFEFSHSTHKNWLIASEVYSNRNNKYSLNHTPGVGILVNDPNDTNEAELLLIANHGDIVLEFDFMMPQGSNSGILFQGRYELQLADSWLKKNAKLANKDNGSILTNNSGNPPAVNASKAPGLWQHLRVKFQAPRFDSTGNKIRNARFEWVYLNGMLIQQNVEVSAPSPHALFSEEAPRGPLMLQGSEGPVAFKNIQYKRYINGRIRLKDIQLKVYKSLYENADTLKSLEPDRVLHPDTLSKMNYDEYEQGVYTGRLVVPASGSYIFKLQSGGPSWFWIDSKPVIDNNLSYNYFQPNYAKVNLEKGDHTFKFIFNNRHKHVLLGYENAHIPFTLLTTKFSRYPQPKVKPYIIAVNQQAAIQRGFFMHKGEKRTHSIMVGFPNGLNYAYSLKNFNMLSLWRGGFIDAAGMWRGRGKEQLAKPLGGITALSDKPIIYSGRPQQENRYRNDSLKTHRNLFTDSGYKLNAKGEPIFFYTFRHGKIEDYIHPSPEGDKLIRELSFNFTNTDEPLYCIIATGNHIRALPAGGYAIDDYNYYIDHIESSTPPLVERGKNQEILWIPISPEDSSVTKIKYSIIW